MHAFFLVYSQVKLKILIDSYLHLLTFTFTFMHLADAFIQSDLQLHSGYTFSLVHVFPGNRTHNLLLQNIPCMLEFLEQCCQVCGFPVELGYFNIVATGCFSCPQVEATPICEIYSLECKFYQGNPDMYLKKKKVFYPPECYFYQESPSKHDWVSFGLPLSSNWAGFVVKSLQPCSRVHSIVYDQSVFCPWW